MKIKQKHKNIHEELKTFMQKTFMKMQKINKTKNKIKHEVKNK